LRLQPTVDKMSWSYTPPFRIVCCTNWMDNFPQGFEFNQKQLVGFSTISRWWLLLLNNLLL